MQMTADRLADLLAAGHKWNPHRLLTDAEGLAFLLDMTTRQLSNWRSEGRGPAWAKMGRIVYDLEDVARWWNENFHGRAMKNDEIDGSRDMDAAAARG